MSDSLIKATTALPWAGLVMGSSKLDERKRVNPNEQRGRWCHWSEQFVACFFGSDSLTTRPSELEWQQEMGSRRDLGSKRGIWAAAMPAKVVWLHAQVAIFLVGNRAGENSCKRITGDFSGSVVAYIKGKIR